METFHILVEIVPNYCGGWSCNYTDWKRHTGAETERFSWCCGSGQWPYIYGSWPAVNMPVACVTVRLCGRCCYFQQRRPHYTHRARSAGDRSVSPSPTPVMLLYRKEIRSLPWFSEFLSLKMFLCRQTRDVKWLMQHSLSWRSMYRQFIY